MAKTIKITRSPKQKGPLTKAILGEFVKAKRTQLKLSIEDAALLCHVSKDTISKLESGRAGIRLDNALQICSMLGIELSVKPWE